MVDVGHKAVSRREAWAVGKLVFSSEKFQQVLDYGSKKGDFYSMAEISGINAAKNTSAMLPLCHNIPVECVQVQVTSGKDSFEVRSWVAGTAKTGFEMEALNACSAACLAIYDMCKYIDPWMKITDLQVLDKTK